MAAWTSLAGVSVAVCAIGCSGWDRTGSPGEGDSTGDTKAAISSSSGLGRFQTGTGLCLQPTNRTPPVGTGLVTGACSAANARTISLGMSTLPTRSGGQGTLQVGGQCLEWNVAAGSVRFNTCNQPCDPASIAVPGACDTAGQNQEWTWDNGMLHPLNHPNTCVTTTANGVGANLALSNCITPPSSTQFYTPLDFNLLFASGIGASSDVNGPHLPIAPPSAPASARQNIQCLDVFLDLETLSSNTLDDFQCNATNAQWFHFNENLELLTVAGTCVTAAGSTSGSPIVVSPCTGAPGQQWLYAESALIGLTTAGTIFSGLCIDVQGESPTPLTSAVASTCSSASTTNGQRWDANLVWPKGHGLVYSDFNPTAGGWINPSQQVAGDFNNDGFSDVAYIFKSDGVAPNATPGRIDIDVYLSNGHGFDANQRWSTELGAWTDSMQFRAGDFDGDGFSDIAVAWADSNNDINIDVHRSLGSMANGGFAGPERWANAQGGIVDPSDWLAGDFDGDGKTDLAYVFSLDGTVDIDVHRSLGSLAKGGFARQRWNTSQGGWLDISVTDPLGPDYLHPFRQDSGYGDCTSCSREAQWMVGDFNGDHLDDLGIAFDDGSGHINLDVHLSTGSQATGGFVLQYAARSQGGWLGASFWLAEDMNDDGRADIVDIYDANLANIDVHVSTINGLSIPSTNGFSLVSYATFLNTNFYFPRETSDLKGTILPGHFLHPRSSQLGDLAFITERYVPAPPNDVIGGLPDLGFVAIGAAF